MMKEAFAVAFEEWKLRYERDPSRFSGIGGSVEYGDDCADYFTAILDELSGGRPWSTIKKKDPDQNPNRPPFETFMRPTCKRLAIGWSHRNELFSGALGQVRMKAATSMGLAIVPVLMWVYIGRECYTNHHWFGWECLSVSMIVFSCFNFAHHLRAWRSK